MKAVKKHMELTTNAPEKRETKPASNRPGAAPKTTLDYALGRAEEGFRVFPLAEGTKIPIADMKWKERATTDPAIIKEMWTRNGKIQNYNIGVALDADVIVVDVDVRDGRAGAKSLALIEAIYDPLPVTYRIHTSSRGDHHYFKVDPAQGPFAAKLAENVDLKTLGGYVVGEGSVIDGKRYARVGSATPAQTQPFPQPFVELTKRPTPKAAKGEALVDQDQPEQIERAKQWLRDRAPDSGTYAVACRVKDEGISREKCLELLMTEWVEPRNLGKTLDHVEFRVNNAYRYGQNAIGSRDPETEFEAVPHVDRRSVKADSKSRSFDFRPVEPFDFSTLRPRPWVVERLALRRAVTGLIAPGGIGKTTFLIMLAVAVATGRGDILGFKVRERCRVFLWNQEDPEEELHLRLAAVMTAFDVAWDDLELDGQRMLFVESGVGRDEPFLVSKETSDTPKPTPEVERLSRFIAEQGIGFAIFDPLVELSDSDENNNVKMRAVAGIFRDRIAVRNDCAVVLAHHTKKPPDANGDGFAGNIDAMRGASSLAAVFRLAATLFTVDPKLAKKLGIPDSERHRFVRYDDAKSNPTLLSGTPRLFRREGVTLGGIGGEEVGVLRPESAEAIKTSFAGTQHNARQKFLSAIRAALIAEGGKATVMFVAECLLHDLEFQDRRLDSLRTEITRIVKDHATCDNGDKISLAKERVPGKHGSHNVLTLIIADKNEMVSAKPSAINEPAEIQ